MKVEAKGFSDRLDVGYERNRRLMDDFKVFGQSDWKDEVAIN